MMASFWARLIVHLDASLVVEPGQSAAIVGRTGTGKSTMLGLIPRFYDVNAGQCALTSDVRTIRAVAAAADYLVLAGIRALSHHNLAEHCLRQSSRRGRGRSRRAGGQRARLHHGAAAGLATPWSSGETRSPAGAAASRLFARSCATPIRSSTAVGVARLGIGGVFSLPAMRLMDGRTSMIAHRLATVRRADVIRARRRRIVEVHARGPAGSRWMHTHLHNIQFGNARRAAVCDAVDCAARGRDWSI